MAFNLTLASATFGGGEFSNALAGGIGRTSALGIQRVPPFTAEAWAKTANSLGFATMYVLGAAGFVQFGSLTSSGYAFVEIGDSFTLLTSTVNVRDGAPHHFRVVAASTTDVKLYIDGVLAASYSGAAIAFTTRNDNAVDIGALRYAGNSADAGPWSGGYIDEVAFWDSAINSAGFTPPTSAYTGSESGLIALYHLQADGTDSKAAAAAPGAPTIGTLAGGSGSASVTFTAPASDGGSTITGYTATLYKVSDNSPAGSNTGATSPINITATNGIAVYAKVKATNAIGTGADSAASNNVTPASAAATAVLVSGPSGGVIGAASTNFTASLNGTFPGTVRYTPNDASGAGSFSPPFVDLTTSSNATFTYTAASAGAKAISGTNNGSLANPSSTYTATASQMGLIHFSPGNWNVTGSRATTINSGAYFATIFPGTSATLNFDLAGTTGTPVWIKYRIDGIGAWHHVAVNASSLTLDMTNTDPAFATNDGHVLEVHVITWDATATNRWSPQQAGLVLTGITLDSGAALTLPQTALNKWILFCGDSITENVALHSNIYDSASWAVLAGQALGCDYGIVGFASQGWLAAGQSNVPTFPNTWDYLYGTVQRNPPTDPAMIVINHGTNDLSGNVTAAATATLNAILTKYPTSKVVVMRPFSGTQAANLAAAVAAVANPRCTFLDTTGWYNQAAHGNRLHPYANITATDIAPRAINALSAILAGAVVPPTLSTRTVTVTGLKLDATTVAANLTGLKVSFRDAATPDLAGALTYQSSTETTDGAGTLTFTCSSSLAIGALGWIDIKGAGVKYCGSVAVA